MIRAGVTEVLVDVVVRDKSGKLIRNPQPGEVQVLENGVDQKVNPAAGRSDAIYR